MKIHRLIYLLIISVSLVVSCEHRPLQDPMDMHYIKVYVNDDVKNITTGFYNESYTRPSLNYPSVMRVMLGDPTTGNRVYDRLLTHVGNDEQGCYLDGYINCESGTYLLLAYNWDTESSIIDGQNNYNTANTYTNIAHNIMSPSADKLHNAPDFVYVAKDLVSINSSVNIDTLRYKNDYEYFTAYSIVEAFYIQFPIRHIEYCSSITANVYGVSGGKELVSNKLDTSRVALELDIYKGLVINDVTSVYSTFTTFGYFSSYTSDAFLKCALTSTDGTIYNITIDITTEIRQAIENKSNWIIINDIIEIPKPKSFEGGFGPGISDWTEYDSDIVI